MFWIERRAFSIMGMSAGEAPAIPAWSNYGKRPNEYRTGEDVGLAPGVLENEIPPTVKFEGPDPSYWCRNGYALININIRGVGYSDGYHDQFGIQDGKDGVAPCRFGALPAPRRSGCASIASSSGRIAGSTALFRRGRRVHRLPEAAHLGRGAQP